MCRAMHAPPPPPPPPPPPVGCCRRGLGGPPPPVNVVLVPEWSSSCLRPCSFLSKTTSQTGSRAVADIAQDFTLGIHHRHSLRWRWDWESKDGLWDM